MALSIERYAAAVHPLKLKFLHKCIQNMVFKRGLLLAFQQHEGINPQNLDFDFCRYKYSSRHFICPVILYSILYNLPKILGARDSLSSSSRGNVQPNTEPLHHLELFFLLLLPLLADGAGDQGLQVRYTLKVRLLSVFLYVAVLGMSILSLELFARHETYV